MKLRMLVGQKKCDYPNQWMPEILVVEDEYTEDHNLGWFERERKAYEDSGDYIATGIVIAELNDNVINTALYGVNTTIDAYVDGIYEVDLIKYYLANVGEMGGSCIGCVAQNDNELCTKLATMGCGTKHAIVKEKK